MTLKKEFEKLHNASPVDASLGLAIIASEIDKNKTAMQDYYREALYHSNNHPIFFINYMTSLDSFGDFDGVRVQLSQALKHIDKDPSVLQEIARHAYILNEQEIFNEILTQANKYNLTSHEIHAIACEVALANSNNEQETLKILEQENYLGEPVLVNDERWAKMKALADELR